MKDSSSCKDSRRCRTFKKKNQNLCEEGGKKPFIKFWDGVCTDCGGEGFISLSDGGLEDPDLYPQDLVRCPECGGMGRKRYYRC